MAGDSGPEAGARSVAEGIKGRAKQLVGGLVGNRAITDEGRAQREKAEAARALAEAEAEAEAARARVAAHEAAQGSPE